MAQTYWNISKLIVEQEQKGEAKSEYEQFLIKGLAKKLTRVFWQRFYRDQNDGDDNRTK